MSPRVKIRGIYSTALTKLALDLGFRIVEPSEKIRERFYAVSFLDGEYEILVQHREDLQGIEVRGEAEHVSALLAHLQETLLDAIILSCRPSDDDEQVVIASIELPGGAKERLDRVRSSVVPTIENHHRLKIINPDLVESAEIELSLSPENRIDLENRLIGKAILEPLIKGRQFRLEHIRPSGKPMRPRLGILQSACRNRVVFKREFMPGGRYDGLDLPISTSDYCLTEVKEGEWHIRHSYFSKEHVLIGEYFNINTPVELYPYGARYVDLELDVIRRAGERAFAIDQEKLAVLVGKGCIGKELHEKVIETSEQLLGDLDCERI